MTVRHEHRPGRSAASTSPPLTGKQRAMLEFIIEHSRVRGYPPTIREIAAQFGFSAVGTVQGYVRALVRKGFLRRDKDHARSFAVTNYPGNPFHIPVLGQVAAGQPVLAPEHFNGSLPCGELVAKPRETFALRVRGDSMIDAGILDGDFVLVHRRATARDGEIVVVRVNDEVTVKRFFRTGGKQIRLVPENKTMRPITVTAPHEVEVVGSVVGVYRTME